MLHELHQLPTSFGVKALMQPVPVTVSVQATVQESVSKIRASADRTNIFYVYVVDEAGVLRGSVSIRSLLVSNEDTQIRDLYSPQLVALHEDTPLREAYQRFSESRFLSLPVVDSKGKPVGVLNAPDLVREQQRTAQSLFEERNRGEFFELFGIKAEYAGSSLWRTARQRLPWLGINILGGIGSAIFIHRLTGTLPHAVGFLAFLPVLLIVSESIGMQTASIVIANLNRTKAKTRFLSVFQREAGVSLLVGLVCGSAVGAFCYLWQGDLVVAKTIGLSLPLAAVFVSFLGTVIPEFLHRLKWDPKIAAGPVVLAVADFGVLLLYLLCAHSLVS